MFYRLFCLFMWFLGVVLQKQLHISSLTNKTNSLQNSSARWCDWSNTVWIKKYKDCYSCSSSQSISKVGGFATTLGDGSLVELQQNTVFNDPVVKKWPWIRLGLDGVLRTEGHVVDQDANEGSHNLSRHPWAVPRTLKWEFNTRLQRKRRKRSNRW